MTIYFEDLSPGNTATFGSYDVTEAEIRDFASQYDPQWFHTDPERAESESIYDGLIASGWHTAAMTMRMIVDNHLQDAMSLGALAVEDLKWPNPVFPGDTLSVEMEVEETRVSESHTDRGIVKTFSRTVDGSGETKMEMTSVVLYGRRGE